MGFFSSIGKVFKKVAAPVAGVLGTALGGPAAGVAGAAMADAVWGSGDDSSDWQKSAYGDQMALARQQFDFNKQYVQNQLQWRVADAQKAGLHPMAALGINGASFSGVSMPSIPNVSDSTFDPVELGQSAAYAATKAKTTKQQEQAFALSQSLAGEQIRGVQLDNELKQLEIMSLASRMTQAGPAAPDINGGRNLVGGQGDSPFMDKPIVRDGWLLDEKGRKVGIIPSEDLSDRTEDKLIIEWIPWGGSAIRSARAKFLGQKVAGHWWHGEDKGFLPYPPKNSNLKGRGSFSENVRNVIRFYRDYDG